MTVETRLEGFEPYRGPYEVRLTLRVWQEGFQISCAACNQILYHRTFIMAGPGIHEAVGMVAESHIGLCKGFSQVVTPEQRESPHSAGK